MEMEEKKTIPNAVVMFVDIRGFSEWSNNIEAWQYIEEFIGEFFDIIKRNFNENSFIKELGDGAMIVKELEERVNKDTLEEKIKEILDKIDYVNEEFKGLCDRFSVDHGYRTDLRLGWSVVRGTIKKLRNDYVGSNINKSQRLCQIARPFGIVIEKEDFPFLPDEKKPLFFEKTIKIEGIGNVNVWISKEIASKLIPRELLQETPEVHVAGLCIREDKEGIKALIAKRSEDRELYPGLYEGCGGQLARSEFFTDGVKRHYRLELGLEVDVVEDIHKFYRIERPNQPLIPGILFLCIYRGGEPKSIHHTEIKWVTKSELEKIPEDRFIKGLKKAFIEFIEEYERRKRNKN